MAEDAGDWLVLSRLVGVLPLGDGRFVASHALGRSFVVGDATVGALLDWFTAPRGLDTLRQPPDAPHELLDRVLDQLRGAGILRRAGHNEAERIRAFYRTRLREPEPHIPPERGASTLTPRWLTTLGGMAPNALTQIPDADATLILSSALCVLPLDGDEVLVTHPLHPPVHMTGELWRLAAAFKTSARVDDAFRGAAGAGLSDDEARLVCAALCRWFILWPSTAAEADRARELVGPPDGSSLRVEHPVAWRWRQKFAPYTVRDAGRCHAAGSVALVGPCHLQLAAEALEVLAQREGIYLEVAGLLDPADRRLADRPWSVVVLSSTQYAASLYEAIAAEDLDHVSRLATALAARVDEAVDEIRTLTPAPLLVTSISPPGLPPSGPESAFWHSSAAVLARLNAEIASRLKRRGDAWLLDEGRLAADASPGIYWDDEFNALPHHSAASSWSWLVVKPDVVDEPFAGEHAAGPAPERGQVDPAFVLGSAILHVIERLHVDRPVRLIVFDPDETLWRGRIADRAAAYEKPPHFYADVEDYVYAGIHEALSVLRRRGILLAASSSCEPGRVVARWTSPSTLKHLVRREDLVALEGGGAWPERLRRVLDRLGIPEQEVLVIGFPAPELSEFRGRIYVGPRFGLRRFLLTAPTLNPLRSSEHPRPRPAPTSHDAALSRADPETLAVGPAAFEADVYEVIAAALRASPAAVACSNDLRMLGLDSLGAVDLVCALEARFGVSFEDHQMVEPVLFVPAALCIAVREAIQRAETRNPPRPMAARSDCYGGRSYDAWCAGDLASIVASHIESPRVPWIFKVVGSAAPFDAEYLSWKTVTSLARGYAAAYAAAGASPGDRIAIAAPHGSALIGAFVGAVLGRFVPCVFPPFPAPPDALRHAVGQIGPRVVVCGADQEEHAASALRSGGFDGAFVASPASDAPYDWPARRGAGAPLLVQQTSGTTGLRKAVALDDRRVLSQIWQIGHAIECVPGDRIATWLPMYHDMGFICTLVLPLALSLPTVVISPHDWVKQPFLLLREISDERATLAWMPNFALAHSARRADERQLAGLDLSALRVLVNGGEPVTAAAITTFLRRFAPYGLRASALTTGYGAAEATAAMTQSPPGGSARRIRVDARVFEEQDDARPVGPERTDEDVREFVSSGHALSHTQIRIVTGDGRPAAEGQVGEILISGDAVAAQYDGDPNVSASALRDGEFRPGDLGFRLGDDIFLTGRKDDLIVIAGRKIYPHALEEAASEVDGIHPGRIVAFGVPAEGGVTQRLVVLAEARADGLTAAEEERLTAAVASRLLDRWDLPAAVAIVARGTLIKTSSGKASRCRNRALYLERVLPAEAMRS